MPNGETAQSDNTAQSCNFAHSSNTKQTDDVAHSGNSALISVIVPVYNAAEYLPRCIESILCQTHRNLDILLIDDGSTDGCGEVCDSYAREDSRIRVIHQQNSGVSTARNAGLDAARGDWIGFVDADDWIEPEMYETLLRTAQTNGKLISVCGFVKSVRSG